MSWRRSVPITCACVGCSSSVRSRPAPRIQNSQPEQVRRPHQWICGRPRRQNSGSRIAPVLASSLRKRAPGYTKPGFPDPRTAQKPFATS